ncbi:MAG: hypothetical protein NTW87_30865 [Planctomycetota bacterium]|nr:hypothetical protein [Planctomycetota bacterium]
MDNVPPATTPPAAPRVPGQPPEKKGLHPLAWVGIGCAVLAVLGVVLFLVLGVFFFKGVKRNVRMQGGKAVITAPDGEVTVNGAKNELPAWLPAYPGAAVTGNVSLKNPKGETVTVSFETADPAEKVLSYYEQAFQKAGFELSTFKDGKGAIINGTDKPRARSAMVIVSAGKGKTSITVTCEKKSAIEPVEQQ